MENDYYHWYVEHGICGSCGKQDVVPGRSFCYECLEKGRKYKAEKISNLSPDALVAFRKHKSSKQHELREKRKANKQCVQCGNPKIYNGTKYCMECLLRRRKQNAVARQLKSKHRIRGVECLWCGKDVVRGKFYCSECLERKRKYANFERKYAQESNEKLRSKIHVDILECKSESQTV